jgi:hypothetical protein
VRQGAETVSTRQVQIEKQQIGARVVFQDSEQSGDILRFKCLALRTRRSDCAAQRVAIQRVIINDENFVFDMCVPTTLVESRRARRESIIDVG